MSARCCRTTATIASASNVEVRGLGLGADYDTHVIGLIISITSRDKIECYFQPVRAVQVEVADLGFRQHRRIGYTTFRNIKNA